MPNLINDYAIEMANHLPELTQIEQTQNSVPNRRKILQIAALGAVSSASLWLPRSSWSQPKFQSNPFKLGVASGSPTHDSVVLWTRLVDDGFLGSKIGISPITVRWEVAHDDTFTRIVQSGQSQAVAELAHSVHVDVPNLQPDRWYFYRFMVGDAVSGVGKTRTFPAAGTPAAKLRMAYASCQRWESGYFSAYKHMLAENLDAVLFLGDYIYEYPGAPNGVRLPNMTASLGFTLTLDDYRARYAVYKSEASLQAMHAACPWLLTWDDHEVQNDYAGLTAGNSSVADIFSNPADFAQRRAAAYQAYYEHMPIRAAALTKSLAGLAKGAEMRIYNRVDFGDLASFYMLDARQYKDAQVCKKDGKLGSSQVNPENCPVWNDPQRTFLGKQQEHWLTAEFEKARTRQTSWNVIGSQTLFGQRDNRAGAGQSFFNDGWDGYPAARTSTTDAMQKHALKNAVFLGGDVHENWVGHVKADYSQTPAAQNSANLGVEFCGTSITSGSNGQAKVPERLAENPHFIFADAKHRGYGVVAFTPKQLTTTLRVVDDVKLKETNISTLAQFAVTSGRAQIERV